MRSRYMWRLLALFVAVGLVAAACGNDDSDDSVDTEAPTEEATATEAPTDEGGGEAAAGSLAEVCPSPLVIQTDWFPESEHGALYELIGDDYEVDANNKRVSGSMVLGGEELGIDVEVRSGGPATGFQNPNTVMYVEDGIHLGYVSTDEAVFGFEEVPTISVVAPLERNPQIIMWDPETYPDVESIADLGAEGVTVNVFAGGTFIDVFTSEGVLQADQIDPSYDGSPGRFISEGGDIAQQGFASAEPYNYEFVFEDWMKPVNFELIHDAGLEIYSQTVAVRADQLEELRPCLEQVVPVIQQAAVDFVNSPDRANALIIDTVEQFDDFWVYDEGLATYSVNTQVELGLVGNGPDSTIGNMDPDRVQGVIDVMAAAGLEIPDIGPDDIGTNEFIDESIGF